MRPRPAGPPPELIRFPPPLLRQSLPRKRFVGPAFSPCFHVKAMLLDFLMMSSCCTLRKTPQGHSQGFTLLDDDFSHLLIHPQSGSDWFLRLPLAGQATPGCVLLRAPPLITDYRMYSPLPGCTLKGRWHLLINLGYASQGIFAYSDQLSWY